MLGNDREAREPALIEKLSGFSCSKNLDTERFLEKYDRIYEEESFGRAVFLNEKHFSLMHYSMLLRPKKEE